MPRSSWKVLRVYGTTAGTRFANVQHASGQVVSVRIRGSKDGKLLNAWGDAYPFEETRRPRITEMAARQAVLEDAARDEATRQRMASNPRPSARSRLRRNPPLVTFGNPPRGEVMSRRVYEVAYKHSADGKNYKHDFAAGVCMEALPDGSIRIYSMRGKRLWGDF